MLKTLGDFLQDARFIALTQSILGALLRAIALARLKRQCLNMGDSINCERSEQLEWVSVFFHPSRTSFFFFLPMWVKFFFFFLCVGQVFFFFTFEWVKFFFLQKLPAPPPLKSNGASLISTTDTLHS